MKCCTNPSDADPTAYEVPLEYFKEGAPEEWLLWKVKMTHFLVGKHATKGAAHFDFAKQLF